MKYLKWFLIISFWATIGAFFHYTLPQVDVVRVSDTYEKRIDFGSNSIFWSPSASGNANVPVNRDVFFIQTVQLNGKPMVYRNEDTGWNWPPYFKFDTSNLQAEASDLRSTAAEPQYVAVRHYGWRNEFISIFPNAVAVKPVSGPDATKPFPWLNVLILFGFAVLTYGIWVRWRRFRIARIDPRLEQVQDRLEETGDAMAARRRRIGRWIAARFVR